MTIETGQTPLAESRPRKILLTVPDVAEICGIAPETVRRLTDRGAMPKPVRLGRAVRYRLPELEAWIADGCPDLRSEGTEDA